MRVMVVRPPLQPPAGRTLGNAGHCRWLASSCCSLGYRHEHVPFAKVYAQFAVHSFCRASSSFRWPGAFVSSSAGVWRRPVSAVPYDVALPDLSPLVQAAASPGNGASRPSETAALSNSAFTIQAFCCCWFSPASARRPRGLYPLVIEDFAVGLLTGSASASVFLSAFSSGMASTIHL